MLDREGRAANILSALRLGLPLLTLECSREQYS